MASRYLTGNFFRSGSYGQLSESRNFTTLDASGSKYYTIPSIALTADFEVEAVVLQSTAATQIIIGDNTTSDFLAFRSTGEVRFNIGGTLIDSSTGIIELNKLHLVKVTRVGTAITVYLDGVSVATGSSSATLDFDFIGAFNVPSNFWDGIIANVKITDAGTLKRFYKIDETWDGPSTVLVDSGSDGSNGTAVNITSSDSETFTKVGDDWLGVELWTFGDYTYTGSESAFMALIGESTTTLITIGRAYKWSWTQTIIGATSTRYRVGGNFSEESTTGDFEGVDTATATQLFFQAGGDPSTSAGSTLTNASAKRILEGA